MLLVVAHQPFDFIGQRSQRHNGFVRPELVDQAQQESTVGALQLCWHWHAAHVAGLAAVDAAIAFALKERSPDA